MEKGIKLCKYFLHGACSKGSSCIYAHNFDAKSDNVCKYYLAGSCSYGKSCRYDHMKPARIFKPAPLNIGDQKRKKVLTTLGKETTTKIELSLNNSDDWRSAPVFVPGSKEHQTVKCNKVQTEDMMSDPLKGVSYSDVTAYNVEYNFHDTGIEYEENECSFNGNPKDLICPFAAVRDCPFGESCDYLHGDVCDLCGCQCLHPTDVEQRKEHHQQCVSHHETEMKLAFAAQRSSGVACAVCLDIVKEKSDITERMFGILENCSHSFCLACIRKWRSSYHQEKAAVRACPICRTASWFVTPSEFWIEDESEKKAFINNYKGYLSTKPCRNFDQGRGECSFGSSCFYKHVLLDGTVDSSKPNIRYREDADGEGSVTRSHRLDEFVAVRDAT